MLFLAQWIALPIADNKYLQWIYEINNIDGLLLILVMVVYAS